MIRSRAAALLLLLLLLMAAALPCRADDEWFGGDKRAHLLGGVAVGGVFAAATGSHHPGVLMGCGVGVFGELIEAAIDRGFSQRVSAKDFVAECAGGFVGAWVGVKLAKQSQIDEAKAAHGADDPWFSGDKRAHFLGGAVVSGLVMNLTDSATAGVLGACAVGIGGELIDATREGWNSKHVSYKDAAAGCLGGVAAGFAGVHLAPNRIVWTRKF
jgi:hypothetical protein